MFFWVTHKLIFLFVLFLGVAGGTASGKSTVCKRIIEKLGQAEVNDQQRQVITKLLKHPAIPSRT